jgi:hypothetical protein
MRRRRRRRRRSRRRRRRREEEVTSFPYSLMARDSSIIVAGCGKICTNMSFTQTFKN